MYFCMHMHLIIYEYLRKLPHVCALWPEAVYPEQYACLAAVLTVLKPVTSTRLDEVVAVPRKCMYVCMHACMHVCTYVRTYVRTYVCMSVWVGEWLGGYAAGMHACICIGLYHR